MIYEYECSNGHRFERSLPVAQYDAPQTCECGASAGKVISAVRGFVRGDICDPRIVEDAIRDHRGGGRR